MHPPRLRVLVALAATCLVASPLLSGTANAQSEARSTPVIFPAPDGTVMSYVINAKNEAPGHTKQIERAVVKSGGVVVQTWSEIGVVVAHSDRASFRSAMKESAAASIASMGATRTAPVYEGTPDDIPAPWSVQGHAAAPEPSSSSSSSSAGTSGAGASSRGAAEAIVPDPREGEQWDNKAIKADRAHEVTDGSRDVLVGVLDTGIDPTHPDLAANIDRSKSVNCTDAGRPDRSPTSWYNTVNGHGTHVAGTIAGDRNGIGIVGVAPNVRVASVKVSNDENLIFPEFAVCGFMWVAEQAFDVTNSSYYVDPLTFWCGDQPEEKASIDAVQKAINYATSRGVVNAAAAGNQSYDLSNKVNDGARVINNSCKHVPAELDNVISVSATTSLGKLATFSNRGIDSIDVAAPGHGILSTIPGGGYASWSGTSMASPHAAGVLALLKSAHPQWSPTELSQALEGQADDRACQPADTGDKGAPCVGPVTDNSYYGEGLIDALEAVS